MYYQEIGVHVLPTQEAWRSNPKGKRQCDQYSLDQLARQIDKLWKNCLHGLLYQKHHGLTSEGSTYYLVVVNNPNTELTFPSDNQH